MKSIRNFSFSFRSLPVALLILGIIAYGIHLIWMGFYWDDWPWIWFSQVMGPAGMLKIDIEHRPISGVVLWLGSIIARDNPLGWQIYNFIWRVLGAVALGWALKGIWPLRNQQIAWISMLFLIYPGFGQQYVAVNNSRHIFPLIPFFISVGMMARANRKPYASWYYTGGAVTLSIVTMFTTEYYYGLELIRPFVLWLVLRDDYPKYGDRVKRTLKSWLPYLIPLILVFGWRYTISKSVNYGITLFDDLSLSPANEFIFFVGRRLKDIVEASITAWRDIFQRPDLKSFGFNMQLYYFGIVSFTGLLVLIYLYFLKSHPNESNWGLDAIFLGSIALLVAPIPFWVTGLNPKLAFPGDRLYLPMIFGACLLLVGLLDLAPKPGALKITVAILIGLSVGYHYTNAVSYRRDWQRQTEILEQITWRIPGVKEGTTLVSNELPTYSTDNSLVALLNWAYKPDFSSGNLPIYLYYNDFRFEESGRQIEPEATFTELYRIYPFESSAGQILLLYQQLPGCLRILDADKHENDPTLPDDIRALLPLSNLEQINPTPKAILPPPIQSNSGSQPEPDEWCYYFEKADLARQTGDWNQVAEYGDLAFKVGFPDSASKHVPEYVVFIEGYAQTGAWKQARIMTLEAHKIEPEMNDMLCDAWGRMDSTTPESPEKQAALERIHQKLNCD